MHMPLNWVFQFKEPGFFKSSVPDRKLIISDPDPQIEIRNFGSGSGCKLEMYQNFFFNIGFFEDKNGLKSSFTKIFQVLFM